MTQRIFVLFMGLPRVMRLGLLILVIGGTLDLLYHAAPPGWTMRLDGYLGADAVGAHLVTLLGMVVTLLGLFAHRPRTRIAHVEVTSSEGRSAIEQ
jgi:hypothetical protein